FNIEEFDIKLDTEFIGRYFFYYDEVESTNSVLINGKEFINNGTVILSEYQTHGRGRRKRKWHAIKEKALTFSILITDLINFNKINLINLSASLAVAQAIENLYQLKVEVKWPNDVLFNDKKISGILIESSSKGETIEKIVVGIGVNVNQSNFPGKYLIQPTSIKKELKKIASRERFLSEILNIFEELLIQLTNSKEKILNDWRSRCKMIGEKVVIYDDKSEEFGIFEDIDENGLLLLRQKEALKTIHLGDVSLRI
ncbi:biotin--[acetyl-CoA-carboxylase] ligase, partial [Bacteroidota bacterium]